MRKAQMEVLGLAIIVILLTLAMFFVTSIMSQDRDSGIKKVYTSEKLTTNTLNAMLKVNTDCNGLTLTQLLKDCAEHQRDGVYLTCTYGGSSYSAATEAVNSILSETLKNINKKYEFIAKTADGVIINDTHIGCPFEKEAAEPHPIRTDAGILTVMLAVCD